MFQLLEEKERKQTSVREQLRREQRFLQRRLDTLLDGQYRVRQERSISECSTSTNSTTSSTSETGRRQSPYPVEENRIKVDVHLYIISTLWLTSHKKGPKDLKHLLYTQISGYNVQLTFTQNLDCPEKNQPSVDRD